MWIELSGVLFAVAAYAIYRTVDTFRDWGPRWAWPWSVGAAALCCATALALSMSLRHPGEMPWNRPNNFGPGWECENIPHGDEVCFRRPVAKTTAPAESLVSP